MLINTNGLAIFGPGSEWFWSMAQFVVVVVTLLGIYRQLRAQGTANGLQKMQFLIDRWFSEGMTHARLVSALHLKQRLPIDGLEPSMGEIADFFESLSDLEAAGHLTTKDVHSMLGRSLQMWWALLAPAIEAESAVQRAPMYEGWGRLDQLENKLDAKEGYPFQLDGTTLPSILDRIIRVNSGMLRLAHDVRSGVIPTEPTQAVSSGADLVAGEPGRPDGRQHSPAPTTRPVAERGPDQC